MAEYQYKEFKSEFKAFKGIRGYKNITKDGDPKYKALQGFRNIEGPYPYFALSLGK